MKAMSQTRRLGEPLLKVWRLDQAALQASAHRTSHDGLEMMMKKINQRNSGH